MVISLVHARKTLISLASGLFLVASISACSSNTGEIRGGDSVTSEPAEESPTPTADPAEIVDPVETGEVGGMPAVIDPSDVSVEKEGLGGFSQAELRDAAAWAAAFTQTRFSRSGLWVSGSDQADPLSPVTYYVFFSQMAPSAQKLLTPMLLGEEEVAENMDALSKLVPQPPTIDGKWMAPAVSNFTFGQPIFSAGSAGDKSVNVAFPYAAFAVYGDEQKGKYWAIEVSEDVAYTLTFSKDGWQLVEWASDISYGEPKELDGPPADRFFAQIPDELLEGR